MEAVNVSEASYSISCSSGFCVVNTLNIFQLYQFKSYLPMLSITFGVFAVR